MRELPNSVKFNLQLPLSDIECNNAKEEKKYKNAHNSLKGDYILMIWLCILLPNFNKFKKFCNWQLQHLQFFPDQLQPKEVVGQIACLKEILDT